MKIKELVYKTDIGKIRENNEDYFFVDKQMGLFIIADGMGGHQGGEVASKIGVEAITSCIKGAMKSNNDNVAHIIYQAIKEANKMIYTRALSDPNLNGMGTTIVLALKHMNTFHIAHVGDSRAYLLREGKLSQLTQDHSLITELLKTGEITEDEVHKHHLRHVLSKVLGVKEMVEPDNMTMILKKRDYFLLCSDGLTNMLKDAEIKNIILNESNLQKNCEGLIFAANEKGGKDNITAILMQIG